MVSAADTGFAMFMTTDGPGPYDVQAGTSIPLPGTALGATCSVTSDGDWLVSGSLLVDLKAGTGCAAAPRTTARPSSRPPCPRPASPPTRTSRTTARSSSLAPAIDEKSLAFGLRTSTRPSASLNARYSSRTRRFFPARNRCSARRRVGTGSAPRCCRSDWRRRSTPGRRPPRPGIRPPTPASSSAGGCRSERVLPRPVARPAVLDGEPERFDGGKFSLKMDRPAKTGGGRWRPRRITSTGPIPRSSPGCDPGHSHAGDLRSPSPRPPDEGQVDDVPPPRCSAEGDHPELGYPSLDLDVTAPPSIPASA